MTLSLWSSQLIRKCSIFISVVCAESDLCIFILTTSLYQGTVNIIVFLFDCFYCLWASKHHWWDSTDQLEFMIFFCCVILLLKPCKQRANTSGTRVNTLVCIWMSICMDPYSQHLCKCKLIHVKGCGKGNKNQNQNERLDSWKCLFSIICPVPFIFSIAQGFKMANTMCKSVFGIRLSDLTR